MIGLWIQNYFFSIVDPMGGHSRKGETGCWNPIPERVSHAVGYPASDASRVEAYKAREGGALQHAAVFETCVIPRFAVEVMLCKPFAVETYVNIIKTLSNDTKKQLSKLAYLSVKNDLRLSMPKGMHGMQVYKVTISGDYTGSLYKGFFEVCKVYKFRKLNIKNHYNAAVWLIIPYQTAKRYAWYASLGSSLFRYTSIQIKLLAIEIMHVLLKCYKNVKLCFRWNGLDAKVTQTRHIVKNFSGGD